MKNEMAGQPPAISISIYIFLCLFFLFERISVLWSESPPCSAGGVDKSWSFLICFPRIRSPCVPFSAIDLAGMESFRWDIATLLIIKTIEKMRVCFFMTPFIIRWYQQANGFPGKEKIGCWMSYSKPKRFKNSSFLLAATSMTEPSSSSTWPPLPRLYFLM